MMGIVLCGGASTRMGKDKGLLTEKEQAWAEIAAQKLGHLSLPVVLSVNKNQLASYSAFFNKKQLLTDNDALAAKGPLLGLLSVHLEFPGKDLFVLACDMKDMTVPLLQELRTTYEEDDVHDAVVYSTAGAQQPLCGIYTANGLKKIHGLLNKGELKKFSMMHVLETLHAKYDPVKDEDIRNFNNYNRPEDF
jgi:molybdopterin-guanine dinucleotide biosynthesis protein A